MQNRISYCDDTEINLIIHSLTRQWSRQLSAVPMPLRNGIVKDIIDFYLGKGMHLFCQRENDRVLWWALGNRYAAGWVIVAEWARDKVARDVWLDARGVDVYMLNGREPMWQEIGEARGLEELLLEAEERGEALEE